LWYASHIACPDWYKFCAGVIVLTFTV